MNDDNRQTIEALERTAHDLLSHINELKTAHTAPELETAHGHLYDDAQALRAQSRVLEDMVEGAQRVYQGG
jgi:hypothetical protein